LFSAKLRNLIPKAPVTLFASALVILGYQAMRSASVWSSQTLLYVLAACLALAALRLAALWVSSAVQIRQLRERVLTVTFRDDFLTVRHHDTNQLESHDWDWVLAAQESGSHYFLQIERRPPFYLLLAKETLSPDEHGLLHRWLVDWKKLRR
jgi:hypothetical protein